MLTTNIAGIPFTNCIYNASGPRTQSVEALVKIGQSKAGAVLSKSSTLVEQSGNALPRFVNKINLGGTYCDGSINSEGLPNAGIDYFISKETVEGVKATGKPYIVSVSGLTIDDNLTMLNRIYSTTTEGISAIELNLACPNVPNKPMIAYDFEQLETILKRVTSLPDFKKYPLGIKLAPYFDIPHFEIIASIISKYPIRYIVCVNTIGNGLIVDADNECEGMAAKSGLGGLGGGFIKHTALANVRMFYKLLNEKYNRADIDIVGVGGVNSGKDAFELILCGAKAVQVGTCHWTEGTPCFERISKELEEIMNKKGYKTIEEFRGKLKPYIRPATKPQTNKDKKEESDTPQKSANNNFFNPLTMILIVIIAILLAKDFVIKKTLKQSAFPI
mmetsp:Transcript_19617/g.21305  ORF Transcript_19617/g.21305 Transcript_19617/m.21305 type:complete len:389 (-) Transcript_19617:1713-2879(-)|eukprot:gene677-723_t